MTVGTYVWGVCCLAAVLAALVWLALSLRRRILPGWAGLDARLAELVLAQSAAIVLLEVLGLVDLLNRPAVVGIFLAAAAGASRLPQAVAPADTPAPREPTPATSNRLVTGLAVSAICAVVTQWAISIASYARGGINGVDAMHYHLTTAAHFVRDGSIQHIHRMDALAITAWYPMNGELLHGAGMLLLGSVGLSLALDLLVLTGVLLSAWVLAAPFNAGPAALLGSCLLLGQLGPRYAGSTDNDWLATWPLLAAMALLVAGRRGRSRPPLNLVAVAGLAIGLSLGTKLTVLTPAAALLLVLVALGRGRRWRTAAIATSATALTGGFWYLRDLIVVGNPLPSLALGVGSWHLPSPPVPNLVDRDHSVVHYVADYATIRHWFVPGLHDYFGPAWLLVIATLAGGYALAAWRWRADPLLRGLIGCAAVSFVAYLFTPSGAGGDGAPGLFAINIRYAVLGFVVTVLMLVITVADTRFDVPVALLLSFLLGTTLARRSAWLWGWGLPLVGLLLLAGVGALAVLRLINARPHRLAALLLLVTLSGLALTVPVERHYDQRAYTAPGLRDELFTAVRQRSGERIGVVGLPMQAPLFGPHLENEVTYLGEIGPQQSFRDVVSCQELMRQVRDHRLTMLVVQPHPPVPVWWAFMHAPDVQHWVAGNPHVQQQFSNAAGTVYRIDEQAGPADCRGS